MDLSLQLIMTIQILVAFIFGAFLGWEREHRGHQAGIRTFAAIAGGACVFGLISLYGSSYGIDAGQADPSRIASNIVVGVGFLGAGVIWRGEGSRVAGLTTAATLWTTAAVGLAVAYHMFIVSAVTTIIMFTLLWLPRLSWWRIISGKKGSV